MTRVCAPGAGASAATEVGAGVVAAADVAGDAVIVEVALDATVVAVVGGVPGGSVAIDGFVGAPVVAAGCVTAIVAGVDSGSTDVVTRVDAAGELRGSVAVEFEQPKAVTASTTTSGLA